MITSTMQPIFVTATNTDIGKTYTTLKLLDSLTKLGLNVGVFKPVETGVKTVPQDGTLLFQHALSLNPKLQTLSIDDIVPYPFSLPAAPFVAKKEVTISMEKIKKAYAKIANLCDIVIIEGAGGLLVPIEKDMFMVDLINVFDASTLLVTGDYLGSINDTLLSLSLLRERNIKHIWCINQRDDSFEEVTRPFYDATFSDVLLLQDDLDKITKLLIK